jgi:Putative auto-transporter adhesin, head GIN domain
MNRLITFLAAGFLVLVNLATHAQTGVSGHFHAVIVSPFIQATFVQGDQESVTINSSIVDNSKLQIEVEHGTLRLYLDGAKDIPHNSENYGPDGKHNYSLYPKHAVLVTVTYKKLDRLSLRGDETFLCESPMSQDHLTLRVYGESRVIFTEVHLNKLYTKIFGESLLEIKSGAVNKQFYTCFGEAKVNATAIFGHRAKVTAFGEAEFQMNVADRIKITSFGEARLRYMGNPDIVKGIHFGGVDVARLD